MKLVPYIAEHKPTQIEAFYYDGTNHKDIIAWLRSKQLHVRRHGKTGNAVKIESQGHIVQPGRVVLLMPNWERPNMDFYVTSMKLETFNKRYVVLI